MKLIRLALLLRCSIFERDLQILEYNLIYEPTYLRKDELI